MRFLIALIVAASLPVATGSAQTPDDDSKKQREAVRRQIAIPETAMQPSRIHAPKPVTEWPHSDPAEAPEGYVVVRLLRQFGFEAGSRTMDREARGGLVNTLQENVSGNPTWHLLLVGHPDPEEVSEMDLSLAEARTKSVKEFLVAQGIAAKRVSSMVVKKPPVVDESIYPLWTVIGGGVEIWAFAPGPQEAK